MRLYIKKQPSGCFFIGVRRGDFSREFQPIFATKVAPTNALIEIQTAISLCPLRLCGD